MDVPESSVPDSDCVGNGLALSKRLMLKLYVSVLLESSNALLFPTFLFLLDSPSQ